MSSEEIIIEEIPGLAKYLPEDIETVELIAKTIPPTKCKVSKEIKINEVYNEF